MVRLFSRPLSPACLLHRGGRLAEFLGLLPCLCGERPLDRLATSLRPEGSGYPPRPPGWPGNRRCPGLCSTHVRNLPHGCGAKPEPIEQHQCPHHQRRPAAQHLQPLLVDSGAAEGDAGCRDDGRRVISAASAPSRTLGGGVPSRALRVWLPLCGRRWPGAGVHCGRAPPGYDRGQSQSKGPDRVRWPILPPTCMAALW